MQRASTLDERSISVVQPSAESFCLVCDVALDAASSANIFYTSLPRNGELLASYVLRVLRPAAGDLRSSYICSRCNELFQMLEQAQWTVSNIRCEILKVYRSRESEKAIERKAALSEGQILADELFAQPEHKTVLHGDRFDEIEDFRVLGVETHEGIVRNGAFDDSANDFCNLGMGIDNGDKKLEKTIGDHRNSLYGQKIDGLKVLDPKIARSESFQGSPNDFCNMSIAVDDNHKKFEKTLENQRSNVYEHKIDCLKALDTKPEENVARSDNFDDSNNDFCVLSVEIDGGNKKLEKTLGIHRNSVYEHKIDCLESLVAKRDENLAGSNNFEGSSSNFCPLSVGIDNTEKKLEKVLGMHENSIYEQKIDCPKISEPVEAPSEGKIEITSENYSEDAENFVASELPNGSIGASAKSSEKNDNNFEYNLRCRICPRLFKFPRDLRSHTLKHGGSRPYQCRKCDDRFDDLSIANIHAKDAHSSSKNCIAVATKPWNNEAVDFSGEDSIAVEESEGNEDLENGNKKVADRAPSKPSRTSKYSLKPLKFPCSTCGKKWRTSAELKTHVKSHSSLRPYMCEKCGQAYKHKHALEIHVGMHNGISPYQCSVCNKCFTQKGALMRHLPMHTGEMPYQCELCGKRFVHHTSYNMHALSHTGKKSYQCHVCDLSLLSTSHLKRHMRVHTGEKPYSCELCGKSFAERYNLFAHQKIHDPAEIMAKAAKKITYKCEQCDESFDKKQKLDDHTKERHSSSANGRKWMGHTLDIESPEKAGNDSLVDQTWQDYNYTKLQSVVAGIKAPRVDNSLTQMSHETVALLMSQMAVMIQPTNSLTSAEIDHTEI